MIGNRNHEFFQALEKVSLKVFKVWEEFAERFQSLEKYKESYQDETALDLF